MDKLKIRHDVGEQKEFEADSYVCNTSNINDVIDFFTKAKANSATIIEWYAKTDYEGSSESCQAQPLFYKEETDEDAAIRENRLKENIRKAKDAELLAEKKQYEKLKAKFG